MAQGRLHRPGVRGQQKSEGGSRAIRKSQQHCPTYLVSFESRGPGCSLRVRVSEGRVLLSLRTCSHIPSSTVWQSPWQKRSHGRLQHVGNWTCGALGCFYSPLTPGVQVAPKGLGLLLSQEGLPVPTGKMGQEAESDLGTLLLLHPPRLRVPKTGPGSFPPPYPPLDSEVLKPVPSPPILLPAPLTRSPLGPG